MTKKKKVSKDQDEFESTLRGVEITKVVEPVEPDNINYDAHTIGIIKNGSKFDIVKVFLSSEKKVAGHIEVLETVNNIGQAEKAFKIQVIKTGVFKL